MTTADISTLKTSVAGMRFIAQMTIYNKQDIARLESYLRENYHKRALKERDIATRTAEFQTLLAQHGRARISQVIGADKHHAVVLVTYERGDLYGLYDLIVEDDYPHLILAFDQQPMEVAQDDEAPE